MSFSERAGRVLLLGATLAMAWVGQGLLRAEPPRVLGGGVILILAAVVFTSLTALQREGTEAYAAHGWAAWLQALAERAPQNFALMAAGVVCGTLAYWFDADPAMQPWPVLLAWAAGGGLFLAGTWRLSEPAQDAAPTIAAAHPTTLQEGEPLVAAASAGHAPQPRAVAVETRADARTEYLLGQAPETTAFTQPYAWWEIAALLGLTLLALLVRVVLIDGIPRSFGGDEGEMGMMARAVLRGQLTSPFTTGWLSHPTLWFFMQALSLRVFGDNIFGLRMLSALIGAATIPALYLFARPFYGRPIALAAAALLATYHFHIHFSRLALNNIVDPLLALLVFAAFFHGERTRSLFSFALTGVLLGLAQHFYMGGRLTPLVLLAVLLHLLLRDRQRLWGLRWHLALLVAGFVLGFGPLLPYFLLHLNEFNARLANVGIFQTNWFAQRLDQGASVPQILLEQAGAALGGFTYLSDRSAFYDPQMPLLDRVSSILFVLGLALTIGRWRRPESTLVVAWLLGVLIFGGMLLTSPPSSPRYLIAAPVMCLLIVLALDQLWATLRSILPRDRRLGYGFSAIAILALALWNLNFYFRVYTPRNTYGWQNTEVATAIGRLLQDRHDAYVYFFGAPRMFIGNGTIRFMALDVPGMDVLEPITSPDMLPPPPPDHHPVFIFLPERAAEMAIVQSRYPAGTSHQENAYVAVDPLFLSYEPTVSRP